VGEPLGHPHRCSTQHRPSPHKPQVERVHPTTTCSSDPHGVRARRPHELGTEMLQQYMRVCQVAMGVGGRLPLGGSGDTKKPPPFLSWGGFSRTDHPGP
jgi:hypothetical protein